VDDAMAAAVRQIPVLASAGMVVLSKETGFATAGSRALALLAAGLALWAGLRSANARALSPIHRAMAAYTVGMAAAATLVPPGAVSFVSRYSASALYLSLFLTAAAPPLLGKDPFTVWFARRQSPEAVWHTDLFRQINRHLTGLWGLLFAAGATSAALPALLDMKGLLPEAMLTVALPGVLMLGIGVPANRLYPAYRQRRAGKGEDDSDLDGKNQRLQEVRSMKTEHVVVALNGSPHGGIGNTALLLGMLEAPLAANSVAGTSRTARAVATAWRKAAAGSRTTMRTSRRGCWRPTASSWRRRCTFPTSPPR
jgi:hypothetical protein